MEECRCDPAIGRVLRLMTKKEEREAKKLEKLRLEKERMYEMFSFEREYGKYESGIIAPKSAGIRRGY